MVALSLPTNVLASANLHIDITDEFIAVVRRRLVEAKDPFVRDSLNDLLATLQEQRDNLQLVPERVAA
ncbi:MAG TPA: hypothetical protein VED40_08850 [Azospirillaceae bacterium]|nr:hypothetical protein [Azospirillaceae bacterium]